MNDSIFSDENTKKFTRLEDQVIGHKDSMANMDVTDDADPFIPLLKDELNQVWTNLINNADYAMDYKRTLKISVKKADRKVIVRIKYSGRAFLKVLQIISSTLSLRPSQQVKALDWDLT